MSVGIQGREEEWEGSPWEGREGRWAGVREKEGGRRADGLDLTGSHVLFYLTSRAHLQSIHLVIPGRHQGLWWGGRAGETERHIDREKEHECVWVWFMCGACKHVFRHACLYACSEPEEDTSILRYHFLPHSLENSVSCWTWVSIKPQWASCLCLPHNLGVIGLPITRVLGSIRRSLCLCKRSCSLLHCIYSPH